jgi:tRNA pseudouridine38-40 synthase
MNFKLTLQYDGTNFHGWQMQGELRTVQRELVRALSLLDGRDVMVHGSGRTDAGVHAEGQVASVQLQRQFLPEKLRSAINGNLEADGRVLDVQIVDDEFHARYSAREKTYIYRIVNGPVLSPFWDRYALQEARTYRYVSQVARLFLGQHD